ncbi:MAG: DNA replication and repair protein RecF [Microthrixaceae bacterium]|nr:DNA replication and repair protein RecF [Acidimicrobiales bacterium]MCB9403235.1 DNA replication and repair protein RecF [Microthrixaceae bacterium]
MKINRLWLADFRCYQEVDVTFDAGLTAVIGANGQGKTNLVEAVAYLATLSSFRGAPGEALVRSGTPRAIVRAEAEREGRQLLLEAELVANGRNRTQLNRQPLRRARDLLGALRVSVFSPDDLVLVKGSPGERRNLLDDVLVSLHPRHDQQRSDLDRILRQRGALLKQAGGRLNAELETTLDVFDAKLAEAGEALAAARGRLVEAMAPVLSDSYGRLARTPSPVSAVYEPTWMQGGLAAALAAARRDDLRRGVSTVGPHRDDLELTLNGLPARTHASQGEQRSLALALRLAAHEVVRARTESTPVLILDDVFSELDPDRSDALLRSLPPGQTILTTAGVLPAGTEPGLILKVAGAQVTRG